MLMPGIGTAILPRAPLPGMEPFPRAGGITRGFSAHSASSTPAWAAPCSRIALGDNGRSSLSRHGHHSPGCSFRCCPVL